MSKINRIYIVGASGTGKSTLAAQLSKQLGIPHFDLDDVRYPPITNKKQSYEERLPEVSKITKKDKWIVEGIYTNTWVNELLEEADQIIWLDIPLSVTLPRLAKRYLKRVFTGNDRYGFRSFLKLIKWSIHYHFPDSRHDLSDEDKHITKKKSEKVLSSFQAKVIRVKNSKELKNLRTD